ncbi:flagellar protein export ATPase FliI [Listeria seeligeri]|uniref:flagellar protein export ATPase FliI n=1 Tax=Listeria seeligeri TaxID=1640 RepID=UPI0010F0A6A4|nr:flagellar protein export ATPase FliI [Listeria seeligeri]MBC1422546.1 flagellar protein export ATPase FliI [Listeria seeligeri]MBC1423965.1 flagellar protein export ATPase FliI [Listeria seeligeri]MBC1429272.1 flagellar protein export ATPase FliI [Listeria seeligeri]MBC1443456.1 flagellar protein export ATPase FliI [Listeria seeligeri]MBC1481424.1 flagellar protein export ATPase FliI [Listeria seeligeri]
MNWSPKNPAWQELKNTVPYIQKGKIHTVQEQMYISKGPQVKIGDTVMVGENKVLCEVISIEKENNMLLPFNQSDKVAYGDWVYVTDTKITIPADEFLLGKVLNASGEILNEEAGTAKFKQKMPLEAPPIHAFNRAEITETLETGIKAIDGMLTIGIGQKIGIFAGSGVGKSTLLGMIARNAKADINIIGLVGERGREVKDFLRKDLGEEGLRKSVIVAATSDESHLMQLRAAKLATSIAEHFRDQGKTVLLMMDSVTRFADARRSVDIAVKELPIGGKTLLMESYMKKLLERSGKTKLGSITGIYTVLVDGDDMNGPVPDLARGILDGHIVLTRELATKNHYPAIDVLGSVSRVMEEIVPENQWKNASKIREWMSIYQENELYFKLGTIEQTNDNASIFTSKEKSYFIHQFLKQLRDENVSLEETNQLMETLV